MKDGIIKVHSLKTSLICIVEVVATHQDHQSKYERRNNKSSFFEDELDMYSGGSGYSSGPPK